METLTFWKDIFEAPSIPDSRPISDVPPNLNFLLPITTPEIKEQLKKTKKSAPGLDGITVKQLKQTSVTYLVKLFNLWMLSGHLPNIFKRHRTILIPKKETITHPGDFRPIIISSVIVRLFHKILAARCLQHFKLNPLQRAFIHS